MINFEKFTGNLAQYYSSGSDHSNLGAYVAPLSVLLVIAAILFAFVRRYLDRTENEMQWQKAHLDKLFEQTPAPIALFQDDCQVLRINREFESLFGYTREEAVGQNLVHLIIPEDLELDCEKNKKLLRASERIEMETVRTRKDGKRLDVYLVGVRVLLPNGKIGVYAIYRDITASKEAAQELFRSKAFLAEGQSISHTGTWDWDISTGRVTWSEEHYRIFGFSPDKVEPSFELFIQRVHADDRSFIQQTIDDARRKKMGYSYDYRIVLPDGSMKHLHGIARPLAGGSGGIEGYIGTTMDITERKRAEEVLRGKDEALRKVQSELAHVTRVATLGEFAASIAHEVNQPITAMHMNANTALRWLTGIKEDFESLVEAREALRHIVRDGLRASEIMARIRELFKKVEPVKRPLDINEAIREIVIMTRNELDKKQINIEMKLADLPQVLGDRVQLQQVILNLTLNSIEAMSKLEGLRQLTVSTHVNTDKEVLVRISDTGPGIASENIENIFEAFHTTKPGGLGMGLSISRSIVESHSGHLWCSINDGPGVSFSFTVPIHRKMETTEGTANT